MRISRRVRTGQFVSFAGISLASTQLSTGVESVSPVCHAERLFHGFCAPCALWTTGPANDPSILARGRPGIGLFPLSERDEADLSTERAQTEAEAWLPRPDVDARRPRDPQAPAREGAQAPLGVSPCSGGIGSLALATTTPFTARGGRSQPDS